MSLCTNCDFFTASVNTAAGNYCRQCAEVFAPEALKAHKFYEECVQKALDDFGPTVYHPEQFNNLIPPGKPVDTVLTELEEIIKKGGKVILVLDSIPPGTIARYSEKLKGLKDG